MGQHKIKQQVGYCIDGALLVLGRTTCKFKFTRLNTGRTWGKPPPSPSLIVYFVLGHKTNIEIPTTKIPTTLGAHNFSCKSPIEMRFEAKLYPLLRAFQRYVTRHMHTRTLGRILTFSGHESN
jgi:hypothetical protein